ALIVGPQAGSAKPAFPTPKGFFGIGPQTILTDRDLEYMKAGGIESIRWPLPWNGVQPTRGELLWEGFDDVVALAARHGITVLPFVYGTPSWIARKYTTLPVNNGKARSAWTAFLKAAVERYGPGGEFWREMAPGVVQYEPAIPRPLPIRSWQIWNEANFFYFAYPASPQRYTKLVQISSPAIKAVDPGAKVILSGLFGEPAARGPKGMPAAKFLEAIYRTPGIKTRFDGIALHPYAVDAETLEEMAEDMHEVTIESRDQGVPFYVTEMGWGSQNNFQEVAFEQGIRGQVKQLKASYGYLMENQRRLNLKQVYWFSWKDLADTCTFCDSVGLFREGSKFHPKPAWRAFVQLTGGRARP
ncbi:MAG TPA: beta-galactosidase, partial [Solirubrobacterales bacterium]|nr:beta-galactosidase [Solirubrobacterales bacterium]